MTHSEMETVEVELEDYKLAYLEKNNIDLSKLVQDTIDAMLSGSTLANLKLEATHLKKSIEMSKEMLSQVEEEIELLENTGCK